MNRAWHDRHPMPKGATNEMRLAWHMAHQNACGCRPIPVRFLTGLRPQSFRPARKPQRPGPHKKSHR